MVALGVFLDTLGGFAAGSFYIPFRRVRNIWALLLLEWKGSSRPTLAKAVSGIFVVVLSNLVVGLGNYLASVGK
jgi:hypothetical protein